MSSYVCVYLCVCSEIPEDPQTAEVYYDQDGFESCSEEEQDSADNSPALTSDLYHTCQQVRCVSVCLCVCMSVCVCVCVHRS